MKEIITIRPEGWNKSKWNFYLRKLKKRGIDISEIKKNNRTPVSKRFPGKIISTHSIDEIRSLNLLGEIKSERVQRLLQLDFKCVTCGIEGDHFEITEWLKGDIHLDLYSSDGSLMTIDHIIPVSKGGPKKDVSNMQIMCKICNEAKGNTIPDNIINSNMDGNGNL